MPETKQEGGHARLDLEIIGLALLLAMLAGGGVQAYVNVASVARHEERVAHTHQVITALEKVQSTLTDAETGQRGYLIVGEKEYLRPYEAALARLDEAVTRVERLVADNQDQVARLPRLKGLIRERLDFLARGLRLQGEGKKGEAAGLVGRGPGKAAMDAVRALIEEMEGVEAALLSERAVSAAAARRVALTSIILTTLAGLALLGIVAYLIARNMSTRQSAALVVERERERYKVTLESIGDAVIVTTPDGRVSFLNAVAGRLTGWGDEALGRPLGEVFRIVNEQTGEPAESPVDKVLREGGVVGLANHTVLIAKDGTRHPIDDSGAPIRVRGGPIEGVVLVFRDITERRRAEEDQRRLAAIVESSDDAIIGKDVDGLITSWNVGAERVYGYTAEEALGQPFSVLVPEGRADEVRETAARLHRGERLDHFETVRCRKDGTLIDVSVSYSPVKDEAGRVTGTAVITRDITEHTQAEARLRRSERELADFFENATVGLHWVGPDGVILRANRAELDMLGYTREEYVGRHIAEVHAEADVIHGILARLSAGEAVRECPARMVCKDGSVRDVVIDSSVLWEGGRFVHTRCFTRDVTEQRRAEEAARAWERQLQIVTDNAPVLLAHLDVGGRFKFVNGPYAARFGLHPRDIIGRAIADVLGEEVAAALAPHMDAALAGRRVEFEADLPYRVLGTRVMRCVYAPEFDGAGRVIGYVGAILDVTEGRRVERALREAEARFAAVVDHTPACVFAKDRAGRYLLANRALATLLGREPGDFPGNTDFDFFPPDVAERFAEDDAAVIASGPRTYEESFPHEGMTRTYLTVKFPLRDEKGEAYAACAVATEITGLKRVQEELRAAAERLNLALEAADLGDWGWDAATDAVTLSPRAAEIFGLQPGPGLTWTALRGLLHEEDRDRARRQVEEAVAGGTRYDIEYRVARPGGAWAWVAALGRAHYAASGEALGMFGIVRDITARKRAEEALRESEGRFRALMEQAPFSIQVFAPDGVTLRVNRAWEQLWGVTLEQVADYNVLRDPQLAAKGALPAIERAFAGEPSQIPAIEYDPNETIPGRTRHPDPRRWVAAVAYPLKDQAGRIREVVLVHEDRTARMRAEEALREREATLRAFYDSSPVCMGVTEPTPDGDVLHLYDNPATCRFFGHEPGATAGKRALADLGGDPAVVARWLEGYRECERSGRSAHFEHEYATAHGPRWLAVAVSPIGPGPSGRPRFCYVAEDVTERRRQQEMLRESEERLRLALDAGRMGVLDWDVRTDAIKWSDNVEPLHGLPPGGFGGTFEAFQRLIHPDDREMVNAALGRALEARASYDVEFRNLWPDGSVHWMAGKGKVFTGEDGAPARMVGVGLDITARKRAEQDARFLAAASASLAALVDYGSTLATVARLAVPAFADWCTVDMLDEGGGLKRVAVAHVDPSKVELAHHLQRHYPPDPGAAQGVWNILRTGLPEIVSEISDALLEATVKDAGLLRILRELGLRSYMGVPLSVRGKALGVITFIAAESGRVYDGNDMAVAEDLARRAAAAIENARLYEEVREADRKKDEFLSVLAHELRNPLAPIRNALQVIKLAGPGGREAAGRAREMAERQVQALTRMVDDLLDVSRIMRGKIELRREPLDLETAIGRAVETARPVIDAEGHELTVRLPAEPLWVDADLVRLAQVISNLLNNAAKYTDKGGRIRLEARREGEEAVVRVRDNGIGIAADKVHTVFDMFMQVDAAGERSQGGLGIGLTVVRNLVAMHGGSAEAHSDGPGRGSEFVVRLPAAAPPRAAGPAGPGEEVRRTARRILIVDDNVDAADSLGILLRLEGHDVRVAHGGPEGLAMAEADPPEVAFLDIGMPVMSGYELAARFRGSPALRGVTLVAMTGWGQEEDRRRTKEAGFDHHLVKPADPADLRRLLAGPLRAG